MRSRSVAKRNTQDTIANYVRRQIRDTSLPRVRVAEVIAALDINRNTFYYYFSNKYDVAYYLFRKDLDKQLRSIVPESELILASPKEGDPFEGLACFTHIEIGARLLTHAEFCTFLTACVIADAPLYSKLFSYREPEFLM